MDRSLPREDYIKLPFKERLIDLSKEDDKRATEIHESLISVDLHSLSINPFDRDEYEGKNYPRDRVRNSGLTCISETLEAGIRNPYHDFKTTTEVARWYVDFFHGQPGMCVALSADDIRSAKKRGEQAVLLSIEMDASQFVGPGIMLKRGTPDEYYPSLDNIDKFYELGVRRMNPILNYRNHLGDGCLERYDSGLSYYGLAFLERMNAVGMICDMSHWGEKSSFDAIAASRRPLLISHAGARSLFPQNKRLKSDELIKALAEKDGLIGVCGIPNYLAPGPGQGIMNLLDHIDYIVRLVGVDHVGVGTDIIWGHHAALPVTRHYLIHMGIEPRSEYMKGIESLEEWPNITRGLVARGYSDSHIEKIIGGNALRLMDQVIKK